MKIKQHLSRFLRKTISVVVPFFLSLVVFIKHFLISLFKKIFHALSFLYKLTPLSFRLLIKKIIRKIKIKSNNKYFSQGLLAIILLGLFLGFMALRQPSQLKAPRIIQSSAISNSHYYATNKEFSVKIGEKNTNKPVIEYSLPSGNKVTFSYKDTQGKLIAPEEKNNVVTFKNVSPNVDLKYSTITNGLKEEIILNKQIPNHIFTFNLNTTNAYPKIQTDSLYSSTFFDQQGNYLFHFEKPFAIDANGSRNDNVSIQIKKDTRTNAYFLTLNVDRNWLQSGDRVYPITIDPTIIHDTTSEFATGQLNRVADIGTGYITDATGGTVTYVNGYTIHTFTSGTSSFTPNNTGNVDVLVVAGGGGGNLGGGGGGGVIATTMSVTSGTPYTATVGTGGAAGNNGNNSVFSTLTAIGGGTGGTFNQVGSAGGSGGGGGENDNQAGTFAGGAGTAGQGNTGGTTFQTSSPNGLANGAGGGGAGAIGSNSTSGKAGGIGGIGFLSSISGTSAYYGAGGGGGATTSGSGATGGNGGTGGGGKGAAANAGVNTAGSAGTANTGGGGGGGNNGGPGAGTIAPYAGGSGVVIVRYPTGPNTSTNYQELLADTNTAGLWHFNEATGNSLDSSGNSNTGVPTGTTIVAGLMNNARYFGGASNYITMTSSASLNPSRITVEAWIKTSQTGTYQNIAFKFNSSTPFAGYDMRITDGNVISCWVGGSAWTTGTTVVTDGLWHHVAFTYDGINTTVYVDGKVDAQQVQTASLSSAANLIIGSSTQGNLTGLIDEMRISNIARTPEEIRLDASRRPYGVYTSDVLDLTNIRIWNPLKWTALGLATGDGETATASAQSALIAQWNFNETSGITADNAEGTAALDGTLTNFASTTSQDQAPLTGWTANNKRWGAGALMFDGSNDYVEVSDSNALDLTTALSVEAWINHSASGVFDGILQKGSFTNSLGNYEIHITDTNKIRFVLNNDSVNASITGNTNLDPGKWYHIVATYDQTTMKIYINGVLDGSKSYSTAINTDNNPLRIGSYYDTGSYIFGGIIDSVRLYSRALTSSEILSNYNSSNIEFQTRIGNSADANDGTWETWKPFASELAIDSMDSATSLSASGCTATGGTTTDGGNTFIFTNSKKIFYYSGVDQTYTVPAGVTSINVKMWGGGGGGGNLGGWTYGYAGGGGGYTTGDIAVTPGQTLNVMVGAGGINGSAAPSTANYGGGGKSCTSSDCRYGGQGGGRSAIRISGADILTAGGGGGGGATLTISSSMAGGGGGGNTGQTGSAVAYPAAGGGGGTQSAGGAGGTGNTRNGSAGTQYQGGSPGGTESYGGGGGGGWYGGGGGAYDGTAGSIMAGGGGGSGYIGGAGVSNASMATASGSVQPNASDTDNGNAGVGGAASVNGTQGKVVITPILDTQSFTCTTGGNVEVLAVAGGGGGGTNMGGGGGGGGVVYNSSYSITANTPVSITVGSGGAGAPAGGTYKQPTANNFLYGAINGQNTIFGSITAIGGGAGGTGVYSQTPGAAGASGGSGGGTSGYSSGASTTLAGGAGTAGQGFAGGQGGGQYYSGGGGGAGGIGTNSTAISHGGIGYYSDILGTGYYWGGGGGGAGYTICGGSGGAGGGGGGGVCATSGGSGLNNGLPGGGGGTVTTANTPGGDGGQSTGGGGGGGSHYNANNRGGDGGNGVVIIRRTKRKFDSNIKIEGNASSKIQSGQLQPNNDTIGLWHFGESTSSSTFFYSGVDQTYTVPAGVTSINVKMWGGGGGGGNLGGWTYGYAGGGGGYTTGNIAVTPGQALTVMVGAGGINGSAAPSTANYGGGGKSCTSSDCQYGGQGGGRSAIRISGADILTAGGGGGGGATQTIYSNMWGGGGGGNLGQTGSNASNPAAGGGGGTQSAGGAGGVGATRTGTAGTQYQGGSPGGTESYGGGGGGGWYGGGGGGYDTTGGSTMSGGGGGSGYIGGAGVSNGALTAAYYNVQANSIDPFNGDAGAGGAPSTNGNAGKVIITPNQEITNTFEADSGPQQNHGTITGTSIVEGIIGKARSFSGASSSIITVPDIPSFNFGTGGFTIELWVKPSVITGNYEGILGTYNGSSGFMLTTSYGTDGSIAWWNTTQGWIDTNVSLDLNTWNHLAVTRIGAVINIYKNGVLINSTAARTGNIDGTFLTMGGWDPGYAYFTGYIDELRISKTPRSASEIATSYRMNRDQYISETISGTDLSSSTKFPFYIASDRLGTFSKLTISESGFANYETDTNTVSLWHLDEQTGTGAYLLDVSTNRNHITPTGTSFTQGKLGKGRYFNGTTSDYITIPTTLDTPLKTSTFSISGWVRGSSFTNEAVLVNRGIVSTGGLYYGMGFYLASNGLYLNRYIGTSDTTAVTYTFTPVVGNWYYLVATYDQSTGASKIYLNGQLVGSGTLSTSNVAYHASYDLGYAIGALRRNISDRYSNAIIDEVRIDNTVRTADEIRQAYEIDNRTHNITIDFKAKLGAGNLITNSSDLGFTVDETAYGSSMAANHLFLGDRIIVRENGTTYLAQGTVNSVNSATGAITVTAWDTGSTFPSAGFSVNAVVFKWQREYFDVTKSQPADRNAITNLTLRLTNGSEGANIWLDDLRSSSGYLNDATGSAITSAIYNRYFQYRSIFSQNDLSANSSTLTSLTLDYLQNEPPNIPSLDSPADTAISQSVLPTLKTTATDTESDILKYKINLCLDSAMTTSCKIFDQTDTSTGWSAASYASGAQATYTVQAADILNTNTTYYWKSLAFDEVGSATWGNTQATPYSFTTNQSPSAPTLSTNYLHDKIKIFDTTPEIRFSGTDSENDNLVFQVSYDTDATFATATSKTSDTDAGFGNITNPGDTSPFNVSDTISYTFQSALTNNTTYFYRLRSKDPTGSNVYSSWSTIRSFTIDTSLVKNQWFETHADQFSSDTLSTTYIDTVNHTIRLTPKVINNADTVGDWVSSNDVSTPIFQELVIQQEGTGAVRAQKGTLYTTYPVDIMEYSSDAIAQAAYVTDNFFASGGTETNSGTYPAPMYHIHTFTADGTFVVTNPKPMDYVMAAGGGGGELYHCGYSCGPGGGGGAGGVIASNSASFAAGSYPIDIGNGGAAAVYSPRTHATAGENTTFNSLTVYGGGQGGYNNVVAGSGGSGGGAAWPNGPGNGTAGQGYNGGTCQGGGGAGLPAGGGGGSAELGHNANGLNSGGEYHEYGHGGAGGNGIYSVISGTAAYYGGGGGGGVGGPYGPYYWGGAGGLGGGGNGAASDQNATSGGANTGGGGGGAHQTVAGAGGSGVVIIRYSFPTLQSYSESTFTTEGDYSLKGVAEATYSLGQTLTRTIASPLDLTDQNSASLDIRSTRTGSNIKIGIHDSGGTTTEITPNVTAADTFQVASFDLSTVANTDKDAIDKIIITIVNADAENTFYIDNFTSVLSPDNVTITNTRTAIDLSPNNALTFWVRSTVAGATTRFQFGETLSDEQVFTYTVNNANTWEKKTWDISGITAGSRDAVTKFAFKFTNAATGLQTFYFDDVRAVNLGSVMSTPIYASILSTAETWNSLQFNDDVGANITYQVYYDVTGTPTIVPDSALPGNSTGFTTSPGRITSLTTAAYPILYVKANFSDSADLPILYDWGVTLNTVPEIPTLDLPIDTATSISRLPVIKTTGTDVDGDPLRYKIHLCLDSAMTIGCKTFDQTVSTTGWDSAVPYASGAQATYTLQAADILNPNTTYYWNTFAIDSGTYWSATQSTPYSFTTNKPPNLPTLDLPADSAISVLPLPTFKTTATDDDPGDILQYKIHLCTNSAMTTGCKTFDQTISTTGWTAANYASGVQGVYTVQIADLLLPHSVYYWKTYAIDPAGSNTWSTTQTTPFSFTTNQTPDAPTLDYPLNHATDISSTTAMKTTGHDPDNDNLKYKINICKNIGMSESCQIYDQTTTPTGWSAADYPSDTQATYSIQTPLSQATNYYWLSYAIDQLGSNTWSTASATPSAFTTKASSTMPAPCTLVKAFNGTSITVNWTDTPNEEEYQVWRVADGGIASLFADNLAADTIQLVDSTVIKNHSYSYLIRGVRYDVLVPLYSAFCSTATSHIPSSSNSLLVN